MIQPDESLTFKKYLYSFDRWEKFPHVKRSIFNRSERCVANTKWAETWSEIILLATEMLREHHG